MLNHLLSDKKAFDFKAVIDEIIDLFAAAAETTGSSATTMLTHFAKDIESTE